MRKKKEWVKEEQCVLSLLISGYFEDMLISYWARGKIWPVGRSSSSLTIKNHYHVHLYEPLNGQNTPSDISCFLLSPFGFFYFLVLLSTYWYCHAGLLSEYGNLDSNIILLISFHIVAYNPIHDKRSLSLKLVDQIGNFHILCIHSLLQSGTSQLLNWPWRHA